MGVRGNRNPIKEKQKKPKYKVGSKIRIIDSTLSTFDKIYNDYPHIVT